MKKYRGGSKKRQKAKKAKRIRKWEGSSSEDASDETESLSDLDEEINVLYGCAECEFHWKGCKNCRREDPTVQRPRLRWNPSQLHKQIDIPSGPVYYPTEEDFEDPFAFISKIRPEAEQYGICRIVPPKTWKPPPDPMETMNDYEFFPKRQLISSLCVRSQEPSKHDSNASLSKSHVPKTPSSKKGNPKTSSPVTNKKKASPSIKADSKASSPSTVSDDEFGYTASEMPFTFRSFKAFADWSHRLHFSCDQNGNPSDPPSLKQMEGEFWRLVENGDEEFETFYGSDLDASKFPTAFVQPTLNPQTSWNVSMWPCSVNSCLRHLSKEQLINGHPSHLEFFLKILGVMIPWVYFGSSLSAFCWHVEDHALYSINYLHKGAVKIWYGIPSALSSNFEATMRDVFPKLFKADPNLLHRLVTHLSPMEIQKRGVPVYRLKRDILFRIHLDVRIEHFPGSFVVTFPNGYHSGFNCGWNCAEAVNFAPPDWLPFGTDVVNKYRKQKRKTTFSHDALILHILISKDKLSTDEEISFAIGELFLRIQEERRRRRIAYESDIEEVVLFGEGKKKWRGYRKTACWGIEMLSIEKAFGPIQKIKIAPSANAISISLPLFPKRIRIAPCVQNMHPILYLIENLSSG